MLYRDPAVYLRKLHKFMRVGDLEILQYGFDPGCPAYSLLACIVEMRRHLTRIAGVDANKMEVWCFARHGDLVDVDGASRVGTSAGLGESIYCG